MQYLCYYYHRNIYNKKSAFGDDSECVKVHIHDCHIQIKTFFAPPPYPSWVYSYLKTVVFQVFLRLFEKYEVF